MELIEMVYNYLSDISNVIQSILGLFSLYGIYSFCRNWLPYRVNLSIGSFTIKRKELNVQNLTNIVSSLFYGGGKIPDNVRREIISITCPKVTSVVKNIKT